MKPNKADKDMWLRTQNANQKLKENVQIQDIDGIQVFPLLNMKKLEA